MQLSGRERKQGGTFCFYSKNLTLLSAFSSNVIHIYYPYLDQRQYFQNFEAVGLIPVLKPNDWVHRGHEGQN